MASLLDAVNTLGTTSGAMPVIQSNTNTAVDNFYAYLEKHGYNLTELRPILESDGNLVIPACAGAGKTTAVILKVLYEYLCGRYDIIDTAPDGTQYRRCARILVSTFLKTGAEDLARQFDKWRTDLGITGISSENVTFTTLHAEFYAALRCMGVTVDICTDTDSIVRQCMKVYSIRNVTTRGRSKQASIEEVSDVAGIFSYYRNRLDKSRFEHPLMHDYAMTSETLTAAVQYYLTTLATLNKFDFEMLEELLYDYMYKNVAVWNTLSQRYDYIFVDEFQDVSQLQYAVLKPYFMGAKRTVVIGDDDQCIYSWRGSDNNMLIRQFAEDYNAQRLNLSTNYRCGADILKAVVPSIEKNSTRLEKNLQAANAGGAITLVASDCDAPKQIIECIKEDIANGRTTAILSRTNADLLVPVLAVELFAPEINYVVSGGINLGSKLPRMVFGVTDLLTKGYNADFGNILRDMFRTTAVGSINRLTTLLASNPQISIFDISDDDYKCSMPEIAPVMCKLKLYHGKGDDTGKRNAYKYLLRYMRDIVFDRDNSFCTKGRYLAGFMYDLLSTDFMKDKPFIDLVRLFNNELPARLETHRRKSAYVPTTCVLSTVHDSKGKEWDSVYIWNDSEGTFPVKLLAGMSPETYEEERRLHYIAWTRARTHLTVLYDVEKPSPFLIECKLTTETTGEQLSGDNSLRHCKTQAHCYAPDEVVAVTVSELFKLCDYALHNAEEDVRSVLQKYASRGAVRDIVTAYADLLKHRNTETITYAGFLNLVTTFESYLDKKAEIA